MKDNFLTVSILCALTSFFFPVPAALGADVAVLFALDADWKALTDDAGAEVTSQMEGNRRVLRFQQGEHRVTGVKMGSGCAETAVSAAALLAGRRVDLILTLGPAGGLTSTHSPGTVVLIDSLCAWQASRTDGPLVAVPDSVARRAGADGKGAWALVCGDVLPGVTCASGEAFVNTTGQRQELAAKAQIVDMNTLGAETAAAAWKVPCLHLRVISDFADENAGTDFQKFTGTWNGGCGKIAWRVISSLTPDPNRPESYEALKKLIPESPGGAGRK